MLRPPAILCLIAASWAVQLQAAVVIRSSDFVLYPDNSGIAQIDLDGNGSPDIQIDTTFETTSQNDGAFLLDLLGSTRVAVAGNITQSFSAGQIIRPSDLNYASSPLRILTGGVVADALGNPISEGWGGCTYDDLGNVVCPPGGPTNQIDLFFVELESGVAWIDLDTLRIPYLGILGAEWAYEDSPGTEFTLTPVPEPSVLGLATIALSLFAASRRRGGCWR